VSANMPAPMQGIVNAAINGFASGVPGALSSGNLQGVLGTLASGALTSGRAPSANDLGDVARSVTGLANVARDTFDGLARGDFASAADAASAFDGVLGSQFAQGREIVGQVAAAFGSGNGAFPGGGRGDFGDAVERLALSAGHLISGR